MYGDPADVVANHFTFPGMETRASINSEWMYFLGNSTGAANAACRTIESRENAVPSCLDLMAAKAGEVASDRGVMFIEEIVPPAVAKRGGLLCRADDVSKENRGEHPVAGTGARKPVKNSSMASGRLAQPRQIGRS